MSESKLRTAEERADAICKWSGYGGLRTSVVEAIREAMRDQRHVSAEAIMAMNGVVLRKVDAHQVAMNASADQCE